MLNFEEELEKFQPSLEVEQMESAAGANDLPDVTDILKDVLKQINNLDASINTTERQISSIENEIKGQWQL